MTEEFLYYLWGFRLLDSNLQTTKGEPVTILHPGERNNDGGPDFLNARIRIGDTLWAGNVEIHIDPDDWFLHNHHHDRSYENVILHVVYHDGPVSESIKPLTLPTLILEGRFPQTIYSRYKYFLENPSWIPCQQLIRDLDPIHFSQWSTALAVERLVERSYQWKSLLEANRFDWEETFYQGLTKAFGLRINTLPFELLAKSLPLKVVLKHQQSPFQLEALAFGQSGILNRCFMEEYPALLKKEYEFLSQKYGLRPIDPAQWKFLRLRPSGFPTVRIAQWAVFLQQSGAFFNLVLTCDDIGVIRRILTVQAPEYWDNHYIFEKQSPARPKFMGSAATDVVILNFVIPFLFFYGEEKSIQTFREISVKFLEQLPGETNSVINQWELLGLPVMNALQTQALIQLKSRYCDRKKCLSCRIGVKLMGREG